MHSRRKEVYMAQVSVERALEWLEKAMQHKPGPYPDPECPIEKWQHAHGHLSAARELLNGMPQVREQLQGRETRSRT